MKKVNVILISAGVVFILVGLYINLFTYVGKFSNTGYVHLYKSSDPEYENGFKFSGIVFRKDSIKLELVEPITDNFEQTLDVSQNKKSMYVTKTTTFKNPSYNFFKGTITAENMEKPIIVINSDTIKYNDVEYINSKKVK